jgi:chromosome segregation ATPase
MAVEERRRIELFERLAATIGPEATATMFDLFPPPGDDHVTRRDLQGAEERVGVRFAEVDRRFDGMDQRFEEVDRRFDGMDQRFEEVDRRFEQVDRRFDEIDHRFELVDHRFELVGQRFDEVDLKLDVLRNELLAAFRGELVAAVSGQTRAVIVATATATFGIGGLAVTLAQLL